MAGYRVGVIFGSRSPEHEVSVVTALQVMDFLSARHTVFPIYITKDGRWLTGKKLADKATFKNFDAKDPDLKPVIITPDPSIKVLANPLGKGLLAKPEEIRLDVIFPVLHGPHGEDGTVQGLLELADLPYVGSDYIASAVGMDKILAKRALAGAGLPVLESISFSRLQWESQEERLTAEIEAKFSYPVIVKPSRLGSSIGIAVANNREELQFNISVASHFDATLLVEPCLSQRLEINCAVLGYQDPRPSLLEQPLTAGSFLTFEDKYLQGSRTQGMEGAKRVIPAPISDAMTRTIQDLAVKAFQAVGARGVARIDFLIELPEEKIYINEINTLPGSIAYYLWKPSGVSPEQLVDQLLEIAFQAHAEKRRNRYTQDQSVLENLNLVNLRKD